MRKIWVVLGAVLAALGLSTADAFADAGVSLASIDYIQESDLYVSGSAECTGGGTATVTVVAAEGTTASGTAMSGTLNCDGTFQPGSALVAPTTGAWVHFGTADEVATLVGAGGAQLAEAEQLAHIN